MWLPARVAGAKSESRSSWRRSGGYRTDRRRDRPVRGSQRAPGLPGGVSFEVILTGNIVDTNAGGVFRPLIARMTFNGTNFTITNVSTPLPVGVATRAVLEWLSVFLTQSLDTRVTTTPL